MTDTTEEVRKAVRKFFNSDAGETVLAWLRDNPPPDPFTNAEQPHQVQVNYGFLKGIDARLKQFADLAKSEEKPEVEKTPKLHNTRSL